MAETKLIEYEVNTYFPVFISDIKSASSGYSVLGIPLFYGQ
jgi:hypothetical protein